MTLASTLRLGLIGDNIAQSRSPLLHRICGIQNGLDVTYDSLVPKELNATLDQIFQQCHDSGYRGINVTYPYKEQIVAKLQIDDPLVRAIGAANTVVFGADQPTGHNTDYSGFVAAYTRVRKDAPTGPVLMIGTGGVGRAVAFGLAALGTTDLRLVDRDAAKAEALADALRRAAPAMTVSVWPDAPRAAKGASGLINCTPVGMVGYDGTALAGTAMAGATWAFDAVYTPVKTQFLTDAAHYGLDVISGWELFFYQGVHAWSLFSGLPLDEIRLRRDLLQSKETL